MSHLARALRPWHRRVSIFVTIPLFITLSTGVLLLTRSFNPWVQPPGPRLDARMTISFERILDAARGVPQARVSDWADVNQIDARPASGLIRVRAKSGWEVQINGETGEVVGGGPRRASWLTALHEGAYFGDAVRFGVFLPSALATLFLLGSGVTLFWPARRRR